VAPCDEGKGAGKTRREEGAAFADALLLAPSLPLPKPPDLDEVEAAGRLKEGGLRVAFPLVLTRPDIEAARSVSRKGLYFNCCRTRAAQCDGPEEQPGVTQLAATKEQEARPNSKRAKQSKNYKRNASYISFKRSHTCVVFDTHSRSCVVAPSLSFSAEVTMIVRVRTSKRMCRVNVAPGGCIRDVKQALSSDVGVAPKAMTISLDPSGKVVPLDNDTFAKLGIQCVCLFVLCGCAACVYPGVVCLGGVKQQGP